MNSLAENVSVTSSARLLLVDDDPGALIMLNKALEDSYDVYFATSGTEALEMVKSLTPDLILLDMNMPGMDGLEVCRSLKLNQETADLPVIFVTAYQDPINETRALEVGGVDFITKPFNPAVVRARVKTHLTLKAQSDLLKRMAFIDGLTGIANRRRFDEVLQTEWRYCRRIHAPLTLFMIDIDYFKRYNDQYGHPEGDICLRAVARTIQQQLKRPNDLAARYGGEEFSCLLPECDLDTGIEKANRLCQAILELGMLHATSEAAQFVTISIGVATLYPSHNLRVEQLITEADSALYQAKALGRNQVCASPNVAEH